MELSPDLRHHVSEVLRSNSGRCTWTVPPNVRREARAEAERFERLCRPIEHSELEKWMSFAFSLPGAPPPDQRKKAQAIAALYGAVCNVPSMAFDQHAKTRASRQWKWWPTPASLYEVVRDKERELYSTLGALRQIVSAPKPRAVESDMPRGPYPEPGRAFSDLRSKISLGNGGA